MIKRNDEIVELWNDNLSAGAVAKEMGVSRSTVLGVVRRARLHGMSVRSVERQRPAGAPLPRADRPLAARALDLRQHVVEAIASWAMGRQCEGFGRAEIRAALVGQMNDVLKAALDEAGL